MNHFLLALMVAILLAGCSNEPTVKPEPAIVPIDIKTGRLIENGGVKYYVPYEPGTHSDGPGEFEFECEGLRLIVSNNRIYVNGKKFGTTQKGDIVSFLNKGHVFINGKLRQPEP